MPAVAATTIAVASISVAASASAVAAAAIDTSAVAILAASIAVAASAIPFASAAVLVATSIFAAASAIASRHSAVHGPSRVCDACWQLLPHARWRLPRLLRESEPPEPALATGARTARHICGGSDRVSLGINRRV